MINSEVETTRRTGWSVVRWSAVAVATAYAALRIMWAMGGVTGIEGWPAAAGSVVVIGLAVLVAVSPGPRFAIMTAPAVVTLIAMSMPGHLLFEIPAAIAGRPSDLADLAHRTLILGVGLLLGSAAWSRRPRVADDPKGWSPRRPARWSRIATYLAVAIPVLGFTVPHLLWFVGVPFGVDDALLTEIRADITVPMAVVLCAVPAAGGLITHGLAQRRGQQLWLRLPLIGGRRVPRMAAVIPATVITIALMSYGLAGLALIGREISAGSLPWQGLLENWAINGTEVVFLLWGLALGVATAGYARATGALPAGRVSGGRSGARECRW